MNYFSISVFILLSTLQTGFSQNMKPQMDKSKKIGEAKKSELFTLEREGFVNTPSADLNWSASLSVKVKKVQHDLPGSELVDSIKAIKTPLKKKFLANKNNQFSPSTPVVGTDFTGNINNGSSPLDNSIAISNDGIIVSVANTTIEYYTEDGTQTYTNSITDFIADPGIVNVCDPVVLYDAEEDRFIFFAQECSGNSANSFLLIFFSETNNPADGWNYYKLTGNPLLDNSWFDYPKLGISSNDLFITGNLFFNVGGFNETLIYQMDKNDGYSGESLTWQYWSDIPGSPFTILPVSSGNEFNYGPGIYALSGSSFFGDTYNFYDITDDITGSPSLDYYSVETEYYEVAADAFQLGTDCLLDVGDCRMLSGFYLDGTVHFVHMSDGGSGWNSINYNRLDVVTLEDETLMFGEPGELDYAFPAVAFFGLTPEDRTVMIGCGSVSSDVYPEIRVLSCNNEGVFSEPTLVYESFSYTSYTSVVKERWGDYTGISRKHNSLEPSVWMSGMYGTLIHQWYTRIAEIHVDYVAGIEGGSSLNSKPMSIAPNPVRESFTIGFDLLEQTTLKIELLDVNGKLVKEFYNGTGYPGENKFTFNKANLSSGTYILNVITPSKQLRNEKIIIQ
jgi:hypothetical protein